MHKYHFVARTVAPKREALRIAQEDLAETQRALDAAKQRLRDVETGLLTLQAKYNDCVKKKQELETKTKECEARLVRADKVHPPLHRLVSFAYCSLSLNLLNSTQLNFIITYLLLNS